ncbi:MAG: hypothetical protein NTX50_02520 [Candidatus Sumerlaeota bacterium]|nr:hypothetical protein [Candidatus Sumerlaeota bacterium]
MAWKPKTEVARLRPGVKMLRELGVNFSEIARVLTAFGFSTRAGKTFTCKQVQRLLEDDGGDDLDAMGAEQDELPLGLPLPETIYEPALNAEPCVESLPAPGTSAEALALPKAYTKADFCAHQNEPDNNDRAESNWVWESSGPSHDDALRLNDPGLQAQSIPIS